MNEHDIRPKPDDTVQVALANREMLLPSGQRGVAFELRYDRATLLACFQRQYFQPGNYVTAIEPCSTHTGTRDNWFANGEMPMLSHQETHQHSLAFQCHAGEAALEVLSANVMRR